MTVQKSRAWFTLWAPCFVLCSSTVASESANAVGRSTDQGGCVRVGSIAAGYATLKLRLAHLFAGQMLESKALYRSGEVMPHGAATLSMGVSTFSLNGGIDLPEPADMAFRIDHGATDDVQLGVSGIHLYELATAAAHSKVNLWRDASRTHFFSVELDAGYAYIRDDPDRDDGVEHIHLLNIRPAFS